MGVFTGCLSVAAEPDEDFPFAEEMTGEWYVGSAGLKALNDRIYDYIYMHFLGHYPTWSVRSPIDDYLGAEYTFITIRDRILLNLTVLTLIRFNDCNFVNNSGLSLSMVNNCLISHFNVCMYGG